MQNLARLDSISCVVHVAAPQRAYRPLRISRSVKQHRVQVTSSQLRLQPRRQQATRGLGLGWIRIKLEKMHFVYVFMADGQ